MEQQITNTDLGTWKYSVAIIKHKCASGIGNVLWTLRRALVKAEGP